MRRQGDTLRLSCLDMQLTDEGIHRVKYNFNTDAVVKWQTDAYDTIARVEYGNFKASSSLTSFMWRSEINDQQVSHLSCPSAFTWPLYSSLFLARQGPAFIGVCLHVFLRQGFAFPPPLYLS